MHMHGHMFFQVDETKGILDILVEKSAENLPMFGRGQFPRTGRARSSTLAHDVMVEPLNFTSFNRQFLNLYI